MNSCKTVLTLQLLLHIYTTPDQIPNRNAPAVNYTLEYLIKSGMIVTAYFKGSEFECTEKGKLHIRKLIDLPLPEQVYVDYKGDIIK